MPNLPHRTFAGIFLHMPANWFAIADSLPLDEVEEIVLAFWSRKLPGSYAWWVEI